MGGNDDYIEEALGGKGFVHGICVCGFTGDAIYEANDTLGQEAAVEEVLAEHVRTGCLEQPKLTFPTD